MGIMTRNCASIVVVNWNTRESVLRCVEAVRRHTRVPYELILVDNGSEDGSPQALQVLENASTKVILLARNLGFPGGANRGIATTSGGAVCLLNSDTVVTPGWQGSLFSLMKRTGAGMVGPYTNRAKGRQRRKLWWGRYPPPFRRTREVDYLSFFCVLISREVLDRVGLLDERFGLGTFEDDDYCRRARAAGFHLLIDGRSWVWHDAHATFQANRLGHQIIQERNQKVFQEKWERKEAGSSKVVTDG